MGTYETAIEIMTERFAKDSLLALATTDGQRLYNRMVDAFYDDGAFYVSTNALSGKVTQTAANPDVAVCAADWFSGHGTARNLGYVMKPQNAAIRAKVREAFAAWYDMANDEEDEGCCILEIRLTDGMLIKDHHALRYQIDFANGTAKVSENWGEFV